MSVNQLQLSIEDSQEKLSPDIELGSHPFISNCRDKKDIPRLDLHVSQSLAPASAPVSKPSPTIEPSLQLSPSLRQPSPSPQTSPGPLRSNGSGTISRGRAPSDRLLNEFPVQFSLPSGQMVVATCHTDDTITEVKEKLRQAASNISLRPMIHYILKTPSADGYLSDETIAIGTIPLIETCRQQSTTPKLILVEKSAALTKKEKIINVEIGSLIGSPLCWTQDDSEISQFRKSMTWYSLLRI